MDQKAGPGVDNEVKKHKKNRQRNTYKKLNSYRKVHFVCLPSVFLVSGSSFDSTAALRSEEGTGLLKKACPLFIFSSFKSFDISFSTYSKYEAYRRPIPLININQETFLIENLFYVINNSSFI